MKCDPSCQLCPLHKTALSVCVPNRGAAPSETRLIVVGEAPGPDEDRENRPFVGRSGKLLQSVMDAVGVDPARVVFANVARCIPRDDAGRIRPPSKDEMKACAGYLYSSIQEIVQAQAEPPVILTLGNTALEALTGKRAITKVRGTPLPLVLLPGHKAKFEKLESLQVVGSIHPAAVLRGNDAGLQWLVEDISSAWGLAVGGTKKYWERYKWIDTIEEAIATLAKIQEEVGSGKKSPFLSVDLETTGLDPYDPDSRIVGVCLSWEAEEACFIPFYHLESPWREDPFAQSILISRFKTMLESVPVVGWNFKFDYKWFALKWGIKNIEVVWDGMLAHYWIWGDRKAHKLNDVAAGELGYLAHGREMAQALAAIKDKTQRHMGNVLAIDRCLGVTDPIGTLKILDALDVCMSKPDSKVSIKALSLERAATTLTSAWLMSTLKIVPPEPLQRETN